MLVNCPKCGFSQPKDRYCAKCGVDMDSFKPAVPSAFSQLIGHPIFHFTLIFIGVFLVIFYIRSHHSPSFLEEVGKMPKGRMVVTGEGPNTSPVPQNLAARN